MANLSFNTLNYSFAKNFINPDDNIWAIINLISDATTTLTSPQVTIDDKQVYMTNSDFVLFKKLSKIFIYSSSDYTNHFTFDLIQKQLLKNKYNVNDYRYLISGNGDKASSLMNNRVDSASGSHKKYIDNAEDVSYDFTETSEDYYTSVVHNIEVVATNGIDAILSNIASAYTISDSAVLTQLVQSSSTDIPDYAETNAFSTALGSTFLNLIDTKIFTGDKAKILRRIQVLNVTTTPATDFPTITKIMNVILNDGKNFDYVLSLINSTDDTDIIIKNAIGGDIPYAIAVWVLVTMNITLTTPSGETLPIPKASPKDIADFLVWLNANDDTVKSGSGI